MGLFEMAVSSAVLAPSLDNRQPWRFRHAGAHVEVHTAETGWAARIACGAATYNLQLAYAVAGAPLRVRWLPAAGDTSLVALLTNAPARRPTPVQRRLLRAVPDRHSSRRPFKPDQVPATARARIIEAAQAESAWIELVSGRFPVAAIAEIAHVAEAALHRPDSVTRAVGLGLAAPRRVDLGEEPLVAVLGTVGDLPVDHLRAGFALQRVLLTITDLGLSSSMLSQPIEVPAAREQLRLALGRYGTPQMVVRVGYADPEPATPRRPVADVILP